MPKNSLGVIIICSIWIFMGGSGSLFHFFFLDEVNAQKSLGVVMIFGFLRRRERSGLGMMGIQLRTRLE